MKKKKDTYSCRAPGVVQGSLPDGGKEKLSSEEKLLTEQKAVAQAGLTLVLRGPRAVEALGVTGLAC